MAGNDKLGLIQVYTGDGKGKTTAALGLALRACGQGLKVGFLQFLKGAKCGEHHFVEKYPVFHLLQPVERDFFGQSRSAHREGAAKTLAIAREMATNGGYDILVLDEILTALQMGLLDCAQIVQLLLDKPTELELVLTGRGAPQEIIALADLVTEMVQRRHPFERGVMARRGVDY